MYIKEPSSGPRDGKRIRKPVAEASRGIMAPPVEARHIIIIQALLAHRSRFPDRTPSCDVSVFPRSRAMFDILVISMAVHSTQTGEPPSSDIPILRARWNHTLPCMYGVERPRPFFSRRTRQRMVPSMTFPWLILHWFEGSVVYSRHMSQRPYLRNRYWSY